MVGKHILIDARVPVSGGEKNAGVTQWGENKRELVIVFSFCGRPDDSLILREGPGSWKPFWKAGKKTLMEGD